MIETFPAGVYVFKVNIRYNIQHNILNFINSSIETVENDVK